MLREKSKEECYTVLWESLQKVEPLRAMLLQKKNVLIEMHVREVA